MERGGGVIRSALERARCAAPQPPCGSPAQIPPPPPPPPPPTASGAAAGTGRGRSRGGPLRGIGGTRMDGLGRGGAERGTRRGLARMRGGGARGSPLRERGPGGTRQPLLPLLGDLPLPGFRRHAPALLPPPWPPSGLRLQNFRGVGGRGG